MHIALGRKSFWGFVFSFVSGKGSQMLSVQQAGCPTCFTACLNVLRPYRAMRDIGTPSGVLGF